MRCLKYTYRLPRLVLNIGCSYVIEYKRGMNTTIKDECELVYEDECV